MIKNIQIKYPDFGKGLDINIDLNPGITIIQEDNGWGKTSIINTILSFFTGKYPGLTKLPEGTASISGKINGVMSRNKWNGDIPPENELYKYIVPGKFFQENTPKQRELFTKLLDVDYISFMKKLIPDFYEEIESDLKKDRNDFLSKEEILLTDIMKLKSFIIENEVTEDFSDIESFIEKRNILFQEVDKHNHSLSGDIKKYNDLKMMIHSLKQYTIPNLEKEIESINQSIKDINTTCPTCGNTLSQESINEIVLKLNGELNISTTELSKCNTELIKLENEFKILVEPFYLDPNNLEYNSKKFLIDLPNVDYDKFKRYNELEDKKFILDEKKKELQSKEALLKSFDTIGIDKRLKEIDEAKKQFTTYLEKIVKVLPFDIELFEVYKNGNIKPSFIIKKDGVEYSNLSTGNKTIVNIMIAKLFCDKLGVKLLLIDEASYLSKNNLSYIKDLEKQGYQILICKPTEWNLADFK